MANINRIIKESIDKIINEKFQSKRLSSLYKDASKQGNMHSLRRDMYFDDYEIPGTIDDRKGRNSTNWLDKITDDMIRAIGSKQELENMGFKFENRSTFSTSDFSKVFDTDGNRCYVIRLYGDKLIVLNNDQQTIDKIRQLSNDAGAKDSERRANKGFKTNDTYNWSTNMRGNAFSDWKRLQPLWDDEGFRNMRGHNVSKDWRNDSWLMSNMKDALSSYGRKENKRDNY